MRLEEHNVHKHMYTFTVSVGTEFCWYNSSWHSLSISHLTNVCGICFMYPASTHIYFKIMYSNLMHYSWAVWTPAFAVLWAYLPCKQRKTSLEKQNSQSLFSLYEQTNGFINTKIHSVTGSRGCNSHTTPALYGLIFRSFVTMCALMSSKFWFFEKDIWRIPKNVQA